MLAALPVHLATQFTSKNDLQQAVDAWDADQEYFLHGTGTHHATEETHGHISGWDTSRVDDMSQLFSDKINFNGEIGGWDTSKVTTMERTFYKAEAFNQQLVWDTSSVKTMAYTFCIADAFNQKLVWDTSAVTNMERTFDNAKAFNKPLAWDTSQVTMMSGTFQQAEAFDQAVHGWDVTSVTDFALMFDATAMINDDCKRQLTYASFSQQSAAFDLAYPSWSSAVCPS